MAGRWIVQAVVNGRVAKESTAEVIATYGPLQAADCVLRPAGQLTPLHFSPHLQHFPWDESGGFSDQTAQ